VCGIETFERKYKISPAEVSSYYKNIPQVDSFENFFEYGKSLGLDYFYASVFPQNI
jgi:hypothetical protein